MKQPNLKEIVRLQFNRQAQKFSSWSVTKNQEYADYYFNFCEMAPGDTLLDVSCGSGDFCIFCAQNIGHATGVDLSDKMIDLAKQQAMESGIANTTFRRGDAVSLPYEAETFSIVISKSAFHHYSDYHTIFSEMKRCCYRQGRISIQDIVAYDDKEVNDFFESFEQLVDTSHKVACSKSFILDLYQQHNVDILSTMEITIDLNLNDYLNHAVRSDKDTVHLKQFLETGLKDDVIKNYFQYKEKDFFFKRNVFVILGQKKSR
ncbi:MAG: class I SAM-dependent methyltransferase [Proteobacteria bacterium]|nr:class I SAM-dependent methyltransferase [Pseudomonadota bacterium]